MMIGSKNEGVRAEAVVMVKPNQLNCPVGGSVCGERGGGRVDENRRGVKGVCVCGWVRDERGGLLALGTTE